jgi:hypothetical protein
MVALSKSEGETASVGRSHPKRTRAARKSTPASATLIDYLLADRPNGAAIRTAETGHSDGPLAVRCRNFGVQNGRSSS